VREQDAPRNPIPRRHGEGWLVPERTTEHFVTGDATRCTCRGTSSMERACRHIAAVLTVQRLEQKVAETLMRELLPDVKGAGDGTENTTAR
jgi:SWIM zinc finger